MTRAVRWLGHGTVLFEVGGVRLLADPLLRPRLGHLTRRVPLIAPGRLDGLLVTHAHRDHLDLASLRALDRTLPIVAPVGAARLLRGLGPVTELAPGEETTLAGVRVRATEAVHEVRRGGPVPALGYVVDEDFYLAGDTDVFAGMAALRPLELALVPVWGWGPTLGPGHMDPARAAEALGLLEPRVAVPIHWGTYFPLGLRSTHPRLHEPPAELAALAPRTRVVQLAPGEPLSLPG